MPYDRESLAELNRRLEQELPLATSSQTLRRALYLPFARALAAAVYGIHDHLDWRTRQLFPQTCDDEILENLHVDLWLQGDSRNPATAAQGTATVRGKAGFSIEAKTTFNRNDGRQFAVIDTEVIGADGTATVRLIALEPGKDGNTLAGDSLYLTNPVTGIESVASVITIKGGTDIETIAELRQRVVDSRKLGGECGKTADWVRWAKEISGVTRVWAAPKLAGAGTVTVYFVRDNDNVIYPDKEACAEVQEHLERTALPFGEIYVVAPKPQPVDFSIKIEPDTVEVRAAVQQALTAVVESNVSPVAYDNNGELILPAKGGVILLSHLRQAISNATGEYDHILHSPAADIRFPVGVIPVMGKIEWTS